MCISVTLTVSYLSTGLVGCSVNSGISRGAHKLTRISRIIKKIMLWNSDVFGNHEGKFIYIFSCSTSNKKFNEAKVLQFKKNFFY
jgi:hypothetical protein